MNIDDLKELARDSRLDWGLGEVLGFATPPDLTDRILVRIGANHTPTRGRHTWLRAAAALLIAISVVVATRLTRDTTQPAVDPTIGEPVRVRTADEIATLPPGTTNVQAVDLNANDLARLVERLPKLLRLELVALSARRDRDPSDEGLAQIASLRELRELQIDSAGSLTNRGLDRLADLPLLRKLSLVGLSGDDLKFSFLLQIPLLTELEIRSTLFVDPRQFDLVFGLTRLERLDLSGCAHVTTEQLRQIARLRKLRDLKLESHNGLDPTIRAGGSRERRRGFGVDQTVMDVIAALPALESLSLALCDVDDAAVEALAQSASLTRLDLRRNLNVSDEAIATVLAERPIEWLDLRECMAAKPELFDALLGETSLRYLDISRTRLTDPARIDVLRAMPNLTLKAGRPNEMRRR